jgi:hypothetical protein
MVNLDRCTALYNVHAMAGAKAGTCAVLVLHRYGVCGSSDRPLPIGKKPANMAVMFIGLILSVVMIVR